MGIQGPRSLHTFGSLPPSRLPPPRDEGYGDGMEARVAKLEASVSHIERDMGEARSDLKALASHMSDTRERIARLDERVSHLPTKEFIYKSVAGLIAAMVGVATLAPKLQALFGTAG